MKKKSSLLLICLVSLFAFSLTSCKGSDAKVVSKIPDGFVSIIELNNRADRLLNVEPWESQITFMLREVPFSESNLFQTHLSDNSLVVKYKKEYYINEAKYQDLVEIAVLALEERQRLYNIGDEVKVRGAGEIMYTAKIMSLEIGETEKKYDRSNTTYYIKYTVASNIIGNEDTTAMIPGMVETNSDVRYSWFEFLVDEEMVSFQIRESDKLESIILRSPEYPGLIYRVVVGE